MAYGKRYRSKSRSRRSYKRRRTTIRRGTYKAVKRIVNTTLNRRAELKYKDVNVNLENVTYDGGLITLNNEIDAAPGVSSARIGAKVTSKYIKIGLRLTANVTNGDEPNPDKTILVRLMLVYWRNLNGSISPSPGALLMNTGGENVVISPKNFTMNKNWDVYYDQTHRLCATPFHMVDGVNIINSYAYPNKKIVDIRCSAKRMTQWNPEFPADADRPADGTWFLFAFSDQGDADYGVNVQGVSRYYYQDL